MTLTDEADIAGEQVPHQALEVAVGHVPGPVVVDLGGLTFCDVRSLTSLLASHAVAPTRGAGVALAGMAEITTRVWQLAFTAHGGQPDQYRTAAEAVDAAEIPQWWHDPNVTMSVSAKRRPIVAVAAALLAFALASCGDDEDCAIRSRNDLSVGETRRIELGVYQADSRSQVTVSPLDLDGRFWLPSRDLPAGAIDIPLDKNTKVEAEATLVEESSLQVRAQSQDISFRPGVMACL